MLNAGYTARDQSQVQKHIAKLRKEGIAAPKSFPTFYPQIADRITTADKIEVLADRRGLDKKTGQVLPVIRELRPSNFYYFS